MLVRREPAGPSDAQACNLFPTADLARKLDVLRAHCEAEHRDYDEIRKTVYYVFDVSQGAQKIVDDLGAFGELGFSLALGQVKDVDRITPLEVLATQVIPVC